MKKHKSSYREKFKNNSGGYTMTPEELASHMHYLTTMKRFKEIRNQLENSNRNGLFDEDEWKHIQDTFRILDAAAFPRALIDVESKTKTLKLR